LKKHLNIYFVLIVLSICFLISTTSCSSGEGKEVLSFFFDGVEDEIDDKTKDTLLTVKESTDNLQSTSFIEIINYHEAYTDHQCDNCHESNRSNQLLEPQPTLCYNCHDDFSTQYSFVHGPVASGYCTKCHHPHMSKNQKLLKRTGQAICLMCHERDDVSKNDIHLDIEDTDCTECHNPHGGEDKFLM